MSVSNYDASQVAIVLAGIPVNGFADGSFVSVEQNEDSFTTTVGADGEAARAKTNNRSATITFTLLHSSAANDALSALHNLDINSPNGDGVGPLLVKDNSGRTIVNAGTAWIRKPPTVEFAREATNREWTIETDRIEFTNIGGNPTL